MVKANFDKFSPKFWELMEIYANSRNPAFEEIFLKEFNKIQVKFIPQLVGNDPDNPLPTPLLNVLQHNDSNPEDTQAK